MAKSLREVFKNRKLILEGIKNSIFTREDVEDVALERIEICNKCPHIDTIGDKCLVPGTSPCCSLCGCSLHLKTRSLSSSCADEDNPRWVAVLDQDEEDKLNEHLTKNDKI